MSTDEERSTHFQGFAKLLWEEIEDCLAEHHVYLDTLRWEEAEAALHTLIAECAYDLAMSGCQAIHDQQMKQGVRLHPRAMLRAILDMTEWPASSDADDERERD